MPDEQLPTPESNDSGANDVTPAETSSHDSGSNEVIPTETSIDSESKAEISDLDTVEVEASELETSTPTPTAQSQTLQTLQAFWETAQPRLKAGTITLLKTTIQLLEGAVARLEGQAEGGDATGTQSATAQTSSQPVTLPGWVNDLLRTIQSGWQRFWAWWNGVLPKIRGVLPASINEALSDRALTGAISGILVLVLWTGSSIFSSKPPKQVAVAPPSKSTPAKPAPTKEKKEPKPKNMPEVKVIPSPKSEPAKPTTETPKPSPTPTTAPSPVVSPSLTPSPTPSPKPSPPPLKLTPEQTLIARIQDQVAEVSDRYVNGLIQSVQANFRSSRLIVKVGDGWYSLPTSQQDNLANDVLQRAQQLNFIKLEITDGAGTLLARSPVVGSEMIVLKRSLASL